MNETKQPVVGYIRMRSDQQQDSPARQRRNVPRLVQAYPIATGIRKSAARASRTFRHRST